MIILCDYSIPLDKYKLNETIEIYNTEELNIKSCMGCFDCWVKTPGICVIPDISVEITEKIGRSKDLIIITEIRYGGYSQSIKRVIDRTIPLNTPFFKTINNELHHEPRYDQYANLTIIGYGDSLTELEKETFNNLVNAHGINFHSLKTLCYIENSKENATRKLEEILGGQMDE